MSFNNTDFNLHITRSWQLHFANSAVLKPVGHVSLTNVCEKRTLHRLSLHHWYDLILRHMPHLHSAVSSIKGMYLGVSACCSLCSANTRWFSRHL